MFYIALFFSLLAKFAIAGDFGDTPTIIPTAQLMSYSFVLIVGIEAFILKKYLKEIKSAKVFLISLTSNLLSLFIIVPVVWGIWTTIHFLLLDRSFYKDIPQYIAIGMSSPWFPEVGNMLLAEWVMAPAYFMASYYGEYFFCRKKLNEYKKENVKKAFFYANLWSYLTIMFLESVYRYFYGY